MILFQLDKAVSEAKRQHETELTNLEKKLSDNYYMVSWDSRSKLTIW